MKLHYKGKYDLNPDSLPHGEHMPGAVKFTVKVPFLVKASIKDLNIRSGAGTNFPRVQFCSPGVYTILEVKSGQGSTAGWGRLKSGTGWILLDYVKRV